LSCRYLIGSFNLAKLFPDRCCSWKTRSTLLRSSQTLAVRSRLSDAH